MTRQSRLRKRPQQEVLRACIILGCASGQTGMAVARALGVSNATVGKWRARFLSYRLAGLSDEPRMGGPRTVGDRQVMAIVNKTLKERP